MWKLFQLSVALGVGWSVIYALGGHPTREEMHAIGLLAVLAAIAATFAVNYLALFIALVKQWRCAKRQRAADLLRERRRRQRQIRGEW